MLQQVSLSGIVNYYPFGMVTPGRSFSAGSGYRFGFNGKDKLTELESNNVKYDFGHRTYDSRLGLFLSKDVYDSDFPNQSPYVFASNNPIRFIDYNGLFKMDPYFIYLYPSLATIIAFYSPQLEGNIRAMEAWIGVTGASMIDYVNMVTYGGGPWLSVTRPSCAGDEAIECEDGKCDNYIDGSGCHVNAGAPFNDWNGEYDPDYPNNIFINRSWAMSLENLAHAYIESEGMGYTELNYLMFQISVFIMHEATHWGVDYFNSSDAYTGPIENGALWELNTFGQNFSYPDGRIGVDWESMRKYYDEVFIKLEITNSLTYGLTLVGSDSYSLLQSDLGYSEKERDPSIIAYPPRNYTYEYEDK